MNPFSNFDTSMVIGYLKSANTTDRDVLHSRLQSLVSSLKFCRAFALYPLILGWIQLAVGVPALIILVGAFMIVFGTIFICGASWVRRRMAANIATAEAAYAQYLAILPPAVGTAPEPVRAFSPTLPGVALAA